jgi:hypothetical protein
LSAILHLVGDVTGEALGVVDRVAHELLGVVDRVAHELLRVLDRVAREVLRLVHDVVDAHDVLQGRRALPARHSHSVGSRGRPV